jgi:hypothetical protein
LALCQFLRLGIIHVESRRLWYTYAPENHQFHDLEWVLKEVVITLWPHFPFNVQIPPIKLRLEDKSAQKKESGIPNLAITTVDTREDSFSATRESLEILEMVPLDSPSDDE